MQHRNARIRKLSTYAPKEKSMQNVKYAVPGFPDAIKYMQLHTDTYHVFHLERTGEAWAKLTTFSSFQLNRII